MRLLQLNVERDKHYDRILPFLDREQFDVLCLQEVMEPDTERLRQRYGYNVFFGPRALRSGVPEGVAILSPHPLQNVRTAQYAGTPSLQEGVLQGTADEKNSSQQYLVAFADIATGGMVFRIGTTHFPWTPEGTVTTDFQRTSVESLIDVVREYGDHVLTGDFNAPRGREIFSRLSEHYADNIPTEYTTSVDGTLHRAGPLPYMVDGIFSTPGYAVTDVERICGLSDHCAFSAHVSLLASPLSQETAVDTQETP